MKARTTTTPRFGAHKALDAVGTGNAVDIDHILVEGHSLATQEQLGLTPWKFWEKSGEWTCATRCSCMNSQSAWLVSQHDTNLAEEEGGRRRKNRILFRSARRGTAS